MCESYLLWIFRIGGACDVGHGALSSQRHKNQHAQHNLSKKQKSILRGLMAAYGAPGATCAARLRKRQAQATKNLNQSVAPKAKQFHSSNYLENGNLQSIFGLAQEPEISMAPHEFHQRYYQTSPAFAGNAAGSRRPFRAVRGQLHRSGRCLESGEFPWCCPLACLLF